MDIDAKRLTKKLVIDFVCLSAVAFPILIFRVFGTPYKRGFFCSDLSIRYPYHSSTVPDYVLYIVGLGLPMAVMTLFEVVMSRKSKTRPSIFIYGWKIPYWSYNCYRVVGVFAFGAACSQLTTDIAKYTIGRLRPHFIDICRPSIDCNDPVHRYQYIEYGNFDCQGTDAKLLRESRLSFPSGHSSFSAYTMVYLAIYLQARLHWRGSHLMKHFLQFICISLSWATALSRVTDNKHHWSDVLVGLIIGTTVAFLNANFVSDLFKQQKLKKNFSDNPTLTSSHQIEPLNDGSQRHIMLDSNNIPANL